MGQLVGTAVEFAVAEGLSFKHHSSGIRRTFCLLLEQPVDQSLLWEVGLCGVEIYQYLLAFCDGQHRQRRDSQCGICYYRCQDIFEVIPHTNHSFLIEQIGRIFQFTNQTGVGFSQRQCQVELGTAL